MINYGIGSDRAPECTVHQKPCPQRLDGEDALVVDTVGQCIGKVVERRICAVGKCETAPRTNRNAHRAGYIAGMDSRQPRIIAEDMEICAAGYSTGKFHRQPGHARADNIRAFEHGATGGKALGQVVAGIYHGHMKLSVGRIFDTLITTTQLAVDVWQYEFACGRAHVYGRQLGLHDGFD